MVRAAARLPPGRLSSHPNSQKAPASITPVTQAVRRRSARVSNGCRGSRGGRRITAPSLGSKASGRPSSVSVRLIHNNCSASTGSGRPNTTAVMSNSASAKLVGMIHTINLVRLSNTPRPSSTAASILAKLSSASTMSAALRATSVPPIPIATPMSACFSAGASFTPSPVIATT